MISNSSCPGVQWYVDGAHTAESISQCLEWFKRVQGMLSSPREKILVFGCQNDKDPNKIFKAFKESGVHFNKVIFCPPGAKYPQEVSTEGTSWENKLKLLWEDFEMGSHDVRVLDDPNVAIAQVCAEQSQTNGSDVVVTGSLFLAGQAIQMLAPETLG